MFPLIGVGEVVMTLADAALLAAVMFRWRFIGPRTFLTWLAITTLTITLYVPLMRIAILPGASPTVAASIAIAQRVASDGEQGNEPR
jgi:hypothetical protein